MTDWLSTAEAADRLGVTAAVLIGLVNRGDLTGYRMGRVIRLKAEDVDRRRDDGPGTAGVPAKV